MIDAAGQQRLRGLARVVRKELQHLLRTDARLFARPFTVERAARLDRDDDLSERVEAFASRFGRLQDTLGGSLLPHYLAALGEKPMPVIDTLNRAEQLGLLQDSERWMELRRLRNRMVHEYIDDPKILADALQAGHEGVVLLRDTADRVTEDMRRRGWI